VIALLSICIAGCQNLDREGSTDPMNPRNNEQLSHANASSAGYFICENASQWQGLVVGNGHCVSLIKKCSGAPNTDQWRPGPTVQGRDLGPGTIIATFSQQRYPNKSGFHAAIYSHQDAQGIWVWDQWRGKPVHQRLIRWQPRDTRPANTGSAYRVVMATVREGRDREGSK
jgi:hypothetical protein